MAGRRNLADIADQDIMLGIAREKFAGISYINKFGRNQVIDTDSIPEDVWDGGGVWTPPTAPRIHGLKSGATTDVGSVVSSGSATGGSNTTLSDSNADFVTAGVAAGDAVLNLTNLDHSTVTTLTATTITMETTIHTGDPSYTAPGAVGFNDGDSYNVVSSTSSGASVVHIYGLDSNMVPQEEFVVLNGTTPVSTTNAYYRIYRMHIEGAQDRTITNIGVISAIANVNSTTTAQINSSNGQTLMAIYTIPASKTGYMTNFYAGINKISGQTTASANVSIIEVPLATVDGLGRRVKHYFNLAQNGSSHQQHMFKPYKKFLSNTDVIMRVEDVSVNGTDISGGFDIILVNHE